jgi:dTDP-L-rhamnose 4-epimerase
MTGSPSSVLVTGGVGFIGSHLVDRLLADGARVRVLDNLDPLAHPSGELPAHVSSEAEVVLGDLRDSDAVMRALEGVEVVAHLGGVVGNGESLINVRRAVDANTAGTATLLEAVLARRETVRRLVVASSMVVYGEGAYVCERDGSVDVRPRTVSQLSAREWEVRCPRCGDRVDPVPIGEEQPLRPASVYAITKRDTEELALVLGRAYDLEVVALRYLNTYGPRQALSNPYTGVAAIFAARLLAGRPPLIFEDGGQLRDLVHVSDVARATALALDAPGAPGNAINIATGRPTSVLELGRALHNALGSENGPHVTERFRAGDVRHLIADTTRARELLGFEARTPLADGLSELAEFVRGQPVSERGDEALAELEALGLVAGAAV